MWTRKELKLQSKEALGRVYWKAVLVSALFVLIMSGGSCIRYVADNKDPIIHEMADGDMPFHVVMVLFGMVMSLVALIGALAAVLLVNPFYVGVCRFRTLAVRGEGNVSDIGAGFDVEYKRNVQTMLLMDIFIFLWSLLLVVPGIIKAYEYSMVPYILADDPKVSRKEAFEKSKAMMRGNKWKALVLDLSFLPWDILGAITCGIVTVFYVHPYRQLTRGALYEKLKAEC
ncbi:MAG: DUF975 family protein [Bullifex sp.]